MDDGIIDLTQYLDDPPEADEGQAAFALWGADEGRSRFALPLWRAVYLVDGRRGGIVVEPADAAVRGPRPFVVLDLLNDPATLDFRSISAPRPDEGAPILRERDEGRVTVFLGSNDTGAWYLVLEGEGPLQPLAPKDREDILFLAGECAGLLFLRGLAGEEGGPGPGSGD